MLRRSIPFILAICASAPALAQEGAHFKTRCEMTPSDWCQWGDLRNRNLNGKDLSDSNFESVDLRGATLQGATLERLNLQLANVAGTDFSKANLANATLYAAKAAGANFSGAQLNGVNFTRADLSGADFHGAQVGAGTWFVAAKLGGAIWTDGRKCALQSVGHCD